MHDGVNFDSAKIEYNNFNKTRYKNNYICQLQYNSQNRLFMCVF